LLLYLGRLIRWDPVSTLSLAVFAAVWVAWAASLLVMRRPYGARALHWDADSEAPAKAYPAGMLVLLHIIGFVGIGVYARDLAARLGGWPEFFGALAFGSHLIRWALEDTSSIGTQLSYFGWIAVGLTIVRTRRGRRSGMLTTLAVVQFAANFLFVDRTRPTWLGFMSVTLMVATARHLPWRRLLGGGLLTVLAFLLVFSAVANWLGKIPEEGAFGRSTLPVPLQSMYSYGTAGFAYFNEMLNRLAPADYDSQRVLNPMWKLLSRLKMAAEPPSQVNEVYWVPFPINVGTFLEPWYRDGGVLLASVGVALHTIGLDLLGLLFLRSGRPMALVAWANLCFVTFIAFFTPKLNTLPVWLIVGLGIGSLLSGRLAQQLRRTVPAS